MVVSKERIGLLTNLRAIPHTYVRFALCIQMLQMQHRWIVPFVLDSHWYCCCYIFFCFSHFYEYKRVCTEFRRYIYMKNHDIQYTKNRTKYLMVSLLFFYLWFEKRQTCAQALAQFFFLSSVCFGKCASFFITSCTILPCIMNFLGAFLLSFRSFGAPDLFFFQFTRFFLF